MSLRKSNSIYFDNQKGIRHILNSKDHFRIRSLHRGTVSLGGTLILGHRHRKTG